MKFILLIALAGAIDLNRDYQVDRFIDTRKNLEATRSFDEIRTENLLKRW